jgi:hypothetical protein
VALKPVHDVLALNIYKISKQREKLRDTVRLMTEEHSGFVDGLESMVKTGVLKPTPVSFS